MNDKLWQQIVSATDKIAEKHGTGPFADMLKRKGYGPIVCKRLKSEGYKIYKDGWPDILAVRGREARLIEIKCRDHKHLSYSQRTLSKLLLKHFGLKVEIAIE